VKSVEGWKAGDTGTTDFTPASKYNRVEKKYNEQDTERIFFDHLT